MDNVKRDYYELIGLPRDAGQAEIDAACIGLAKKYHPDKNPGDLLAAKNFALIEEVYETLGSPAKRTVYDQKLRFPVADLQITKASNAVEPAGKTNSSVEGLQSAAEIATGLTALSLLIFSIGIVLLELVLGNSNFSIKNASFAGGAFGTGIGLMLLFGRLAAKRKYQEALRRLEADPKNADKRAEAFKRGREYSVLTQGALGGKKFGEDALKNDLDDIATRAAMGQSSKSQIGGATTHINEAEYRLRRKQVIGAYAIGIPVICLAAYGLYYRNESQRIPKAIEQVKVILRERGMDPSTAEFKDMVATRLRYLNEEAICGKVNAKSSDGVFTGYYPFYVSKTGISLDSSDSFNHLAEEYCPK